ncbi:MAG: GntR family transcriptional regulator [Woeseia sp.]
MDTRIRSLAHSDRVYRAVKARVIACEFPQGRRIFLEPVAKSLGVSTTPVREALNRLAAEDLVIKAPRKGFTTLRLTRQRLIGHYDITRLLLTHELARLDAQTRRALPEYEPIATVLHKVTRRDIADAGVLAVYTGEIFTAIASLGENADIVGAIGRANDRLHYVRMLECQLLPQVQKDLVLLCELLLARRCKDLMTAIHDYHDTRTALLPELLELARKRSRP